MIKLTQGIVSVMGSYTISARHRFFGWSATVVMAVAVVLMFATM